MAFVSADACRHAQLRTLDERKRWLASYYTKVFGVEEAPVAYHEVSACVWDLCQFRLS